MVPMARQRRSIILLFAALWLMSAARADSAERMTAARQDYAYNPRTGAVTLDLTTVYSGIDAGRFRELYQRLGRDGYDQAKLDYYRGMYGAVAETAPLTVKDDPNRDTVETHERYTVSLTKSEDDALKHRFPVYPDLLRGFFAQLPPMIQQPYALDRTLDHRDTVTVTAPTLGTYTIGDDGVADGYFAFTRKASAGLGLVKMDYRLRFLTDSVPVADFAAYSADIERMDHNIFAWIDLDRDFSHRYYQDLPKIIRGVAAAVLLGAGAWWFFRKRRMGRA
jgi:hypothetical protein